MTIVSSLPADRPAVARIVDPVCTVVIDAEEDFDWLTPVEGTAFSTASLMQFRDAQAIFGAYGVVPAYLLTYPALVDADVVRLIRRQIERGQCIVGVQLHTWVTPPFGAAREVQFSFSGNLDPGVEERKLLTLKEKFIDCFGFPPLMFRAGRYGISAQTAILLEKHGFLIDTSLAPRTSFVREGGPDHSNYEYRLFWFGRERDLLEVPLCRSVVGWGGELGRVFYQVLSGPLMTKLRVPSLLTRSRCAERITLSPEGNDAVAMRRLVRRLLARGERVFPLSFHSSSLAPGGNPYVQNRADLHYFYDRLSALLDHFATALGGRFVALSDVPALLAPPPARRPLACP
jgi:hypothetical protein